MSERKRESNFTNAEIDLLLHLCNTNKKILENKTTNAVTWKQKLLAWEKIHTEFNSTTDGQVSIVYNVTKVWLIKVSNNNNNISNKFVCSPPISKACGEGERLLN